MFVVYLSFVSLFTVVFAWSFVPALVSWPFVYTRVVCVGPLFKPTCYMLSLCLNLVDIVFKPSCCKLSLCLYCRLPCLRPAAIVCLHFCCADLPLCLHPVKVDSSFGEILYILNRPFVKMFSEFSYCL